MRQEGQVRIAGAAQRSKSRPPLEPAAERLAALLAKALVADLCQFPSPAEHGIMPSTEDRERLTGGVA